MESLQPIKNDHNYDHPDRQVDPKKKTKLVFDKQRFAMYAFFVLTSATIPIIIYFITINIVIQENIHYSCAVDNSFKIPCGRTNISKTNCLKINGCYDDFNFSCYHSVPSKYNYYIKENGVDFYSLQLKTPFGNDTIPQLKLSVIEIDSNKLKVIMHTDFLSYTPTTIENKSYIVRHDPKFLGVEIFRQDSKKMILSTLQGPVIASSHYWEWSVYLVNEEIFGLGELVLPKNKTLTKVIYKNKNDHTTLPNFMVYLDGSFYGILLEHDGPLEVTIFPGRIISFKSLAGDKIAINVYMGPSIKDVIEQMRVNDSTLSIPYWTLGIHICRDGKTTIEKALKEFKEFYQTQTDIHYASDCFHENLYNLIYQVQNVHDLPTLISSMQQKKTRFLMSMPPQVLKVNEQLYNVAVKLNILYKNINGEILNGTYQKEEAVYPDYTHTAIGEWFETVKLNLPVGNINGFVLRDNWPQEDTYVFKDPKYEFAYMTDSLNQSLSKTIHWNALGTSLQAHILHHNSYGSAQLSGFRNYMNYEFILTSSSNNGIFEPVSVQNVNISWSNLKKAVTTNLYNSMFGNYITSFPVCGSTDAYNIEDNEELCLRWYITSAALPFFRISSDFPRRDPSKLFSGFSRNAVKDSLQKRHMLLPYYYTTLSAGDPLVRPMIFNFHKNNVSWSLDEQYMLGDALLVAPSFLPAVTKVNLYLPPEINVWYEFWGGNLYKTGWMTFNVVKNDWLMFIAEGYIIPLRNHKSTEIGGYHLEDSFGFAVALNCSMPECFAEGSLQLDKAKLHFTANNTGILITNISEAQDEIGCSLAEPNHPKYVENLIIYGISNVVVNSNFKRIDLCNTKEQSLYIPYFTN